MNRKRRILVAEDDETFQEAVKTVLELEGYEVIVVGDGRAAEQIVMLQPFDAVITDIRMPHVNGIQLLHFIRARLKIPVFLMTGFSELAETKDAFEMGAAGFFAKPFRQTELLNDLKRSFGDSHPEKHETLDQDFCKIGIDDFISGRQIQYDIFIRLAADKYVRIAHEGQDLSIDRIRAYKSKNIAHLHMRKDDFRKYVGFSVAISNAVREVRIPEIKKFGVIKHTSEVVLESIFSSDVDEVGFEHARSLVENTVTLITDHVDLLPLVSILNEHSDHLYAHSVGVSMYSVMIARQLEWSSPTTRFKLALGGLLHDVGKKEIDREIVNKPRKFMTPEEIRLIESHPLRGMEIMSQIEGIPSDVLEIIRQHHENLSGQGYPLGLKKKQIHPLARVISVANEFCNVALKNPNSPTGMPVEKALERLKTMYVGLLDPEAVLALTRCFKSAR